MGGEVCFYHKINELVEYCLKNKVALGIVTNGTILDRYKTLSKINNKIRYVVSYNKEGCPNRLKSCERFIKEMKVNAVNILINKKNRNTVIRQIEKFHKMRKIKLIKIFSDERAKKGKYASFFEYLVSKYNKVYILDYSLMKDSFEKIEDTEGYKIKCNNPFSLKGNNISFCKKY